MGDSVVQRLTSLAKMHLQFCVKKKPHTVAKIISPNHINDHKLRW